MRTKQEELPKRKHIRLKEFDYSIPYAYFVTICTHNRQQYFTNDNFNQRIISLLLEEIGKHDFIIYIYCLMPDHLHLILSPPGNRMNISEFIGQFKGRTTRLAWDFGIQGRLWQGRFYDHIVRKNESLEEIGEYILDNPVRRNLADDPFEYKWVGGSLINSDNHKGCPYV